MVPDTPTQRLRTQQLSEPYSHVLFDLDHTLFDTEASLELAFEDAMAAVEVDPAGHYPAFQTINSKLWSQVEAGTVTPTVVHTRRFEQLAGALRLKGDPLVMADAFAAGLQAHGELYPGAFDLLQSLKSTTTLALITNGLSHIQRGRVERLGIKHFFAAIIISTEVGSAKPSPEIFEATLGGLGHPPRESTLMVGDSFSADITGGARFGLDTCWYNPHANPQGDRVVPTHVVHSLQQIPDVVAKRPHQI